MHLKKILCLTLGLAAIAACSGSGSLILEDDETGALYGAILADDEEIAAYPKGVGPWASLEATPSPSATPTSVLLSGTPPIQQQGTCSLCSQGEGSPGSCISWSAAYGLGSYTANLTQQWGVEDPDHQVSAAYLYAYVLNQESRSCPTGTMEPPYLNFLVRNGAPSMTTVPYQPNCTYLGGIDLGTLSDPAFKIGSWSYVSPQDRDLIKAYLAAGHAVAFAGHLYDGFGLLQGSDVYYGSGPFEINKTTGKLVGHGMLLIGYNDALGDPTQGLGAYRLQNSFGTNWGDSGYLWMSYGTFESSIVSAFVAEPLAGSISGGTALVPDAAVAPDGRITGVFQLVRNTATGEPLVHLVFRHQFDGPVEIREARVVDPSGKAARHVYDRVWHQNGYTHLTRRDGGQFLAGNYALEIAAGLPDGSVARYSAEVPVAPLAASSLPAFGFSVGLLGGNGQAAALE